MHLHKAVGTHEWLLHNDLEHVAREWLRLARMQAIFVFADFVAQLLGKIYLPSLRCISWLEFRRCVYVVPRRIAPSHAWNWRLGIGVEK